MSTPAVHPTNWKHPNASVKSPWYFSYRFFDPVHAPQGRLSIGKGMNDYKTPEERMTITERLINDEIDLLKQGYNPLTKMWVKAEQLDDLEPTTPLAQALQIASLSCPCDERTRADIRSMMNYIPLAIEQLKIQNMPVGEIRKKHVKKILEQCSRIKSRIDPTTKLVINVTWSNNKYNQYRSYLMIVFSEIVECEALDMNPCRDLKKKKTTKRKRATLTKLQRQLVNNHLKATDPAFWHFLHIFFHSGARITEIMNVKKKDVDLENQTFLTLVKKEGDYIEKDRTIKDIALPLWLEAMKDCGPNDYLFSRGFKPGSTSMESRRVSKKWKKQIKDKFNIEADFYSLKHSNSTETSETAGDDAAAAQNAHTTTAMVHKVYDVRRDGRMHERLKKVNNPFA